MTSQLTNLSVYEHWCLPWFLSFHPLLYLLQRWNAAGAFLFDGEGSDAVGEIYCLAWVFMAVEMNQESGGKDIACARRIDFYGRVGGKCFLVAALEKGCAVPAVGSYQEWDLHTPLRQDGVGVGAV